jgi:hypothetical protein
VDMLALLAYVVHGIFVTALWLYDVIFFLSFLFVSNEI